MGNDFPMRTCLSQKIFIPFWKMRIGNGKKHLVQSPSSYSMDVKCLGCFKITMVFILAWGILMCIGCSMAFCQQKERSGLPRNVPSGRSTGRNLNQDEWEVVLINKFWIQTNTSKCYKIFGEKSCLRYALHCVTELKCFQKKHFKVFLFCSKVCLIGNDIWKAS